MESHIYDFLALGFYWIPSATGYLQGSSITVSAFNAFSIVSIATKDSVGHAAAARRRHQVDSKKASHLFWQQIVSGAYSRDEYDTPLMDRHHQVDQHLTHLTCTKVLREI